MTFRKAPNIPTEMFIRPDCSLFSVSVVSELKARYGLKPARGKVGFEVIAVRWPMVGIEASRPFKPLDTRDALPRASPFAMILLARWADQIPASSCSTEQ